MWYEGQYVYLIKVVSRSDSMRLVITNEREATNLVGQALH